MALPDQDLIELAKSSELIKWLWGILLVPITLIGRLIWNNHMKTHDIEVSMQKQMKDIEKMLHDHQDYVARKHPTNEYFNQRLEDMITPVQLSVLETRQDIKSIMKHIIEDKK